MTARHRRRRTPASVVAVTTLAVVAAVLVAQPHPQARASTGPAFDVAQVSLLPDGTMASTDSFLAPSASDDGRYVAFVASGGTCPTPTPTGTSTSPAGPSSSAAPSASASASVAPSASAAPTSTATGTPTATPTAPTGSSGACYHDQLFVRDRTQHTTVLVSKDAAGDPAPDQVRASAISGDGTEVAFISTDSLLPEATGSDAYLYVADLPSGTLHLVTVPGSGEAPLSTGVAISRDGSTVAFARGNSANPNGDAIVVEQWRTGSAKVLTAPSSAAYDVTGYGWPQLSADGGRAAFVLDPQNTDYPQPALRVVDIATDAVLEQVGIVPQTGSLDAPFSLSADGSHLARIMPACDGSEVLEVDAFDGSAPVTRRCAFGGYAQARTGSAVADSFGMGGGVTTPRLSADGSAVAVASTTPDGSLVMLDNPVESTSGVPVSVTPDGSPSVGVVLAAAVAQGGKGVLFTSTASDLGAPGDGSAQVYYATSLDAAAPSFGSGAVLSLSNVGYFSADLSWPQADDDTGVTAYRITVDGHSVATIDAATTYYTATGLTPGATHTFGVQALDMVGTASAPLTTTATTQQATRQEVIDTVSVLPNGTPSQATGMNPSVSASGRYVAFVGGGDGSCGFGGFEGAAIVPGCYNNQVFVRDRQAGTTALMSHVPGSSAPDGDQVTDAAISGDGSEVAFVLATNNGSTPDVFVTDRATGTVHAVPVPDLGTATYYSADDGAGIAVDGDGTHVAYIADDTGGRVFLIVADWRAGTSQVVPLPTGTSILDEPELSADGSRIAFVTNHETSDSHVVVIDLADPGTPVLDRSMGEPSYYGNDGYPPHIALSADGRYLAYTQLTPAPGRVPIAIQDLSSLSTPPVVLADPVDPSCDPTAQACYDVGAPALSTDGSTVVFDPMWPTGTHTLYRASPVSAAATPIGLLPDGTQDLQYPGDRTPAITGDGTGTVFQSNNEQLASGATGSDVVYAHAPDAVAPSFATGAALTADNLTGTQVRLTWPAATDDHGVMGYRLTRDGVTVADLDATARTFTVTGLTAGTTYHFALAGVDAALNVGTPLTVDVTTPGGTQPPGSAPLAVDASAGGGHATISWDPSTTSGVTGYRVLRGTGTDGALAPVADVSAPSTTTYVDSGLAASTTYRYEVHTLTASGERNYTVTASDTTPALGSATTAVSVPLVDGARVAQLGSDLTVTARGDANRAVTSTVTYTDSGGATQSALLTLNQTADDSGVYTGALPLADGMTAITGVTTAVTDGAGHTATAAASGLPLPVSGALTVTIEKPVAGSIDGSMLTIVSDSGDTGDVQTVDGGQTVTLPIAAGDDYSVRLAEPANSEAPGYVSARQDGITVSAGVTSTVDLAPLPPAFLHVLTDLGDPSAVPGSLEVTVTEADGTFVGATSDRNAEKNHAFGPLPAGTTLHVDSMENQQSARVVADESTTVTLVPGENEVTLTHPALPASVVTGQVTKSGTPTAGHVSATETVDGRSFTFTGETDDSGHYSLGVLAGEVTVTGSSSGWAGAASRTVTAPAGGSVTADLDLPIPATYHATVSIVTTEPGGGTTTLPVDWTTGIHFGVSLSGPRGQHYSTSQFSEPMTIMGMPGDVFTLCADGSQAGLPSGCHSVTLGTDLTPEISVSLGGAGRITADLTNPDGSPYTGYWRATTQRVTSAGNLANADTALGTGSTLSVNVPDAGTYELDVWTYGGQARPVQVTVPEGGVADAGTISIGADGNFPSSGNDVVAEQPELTPGQVARFRADYAYEGGATVPATLRLGIPAGTTLVPGSVTVGGAAVPDPSIVDGYAEVPLPQDLSRGTTGVVHYAVQTDADTPAGTLSSVVRVRYGSGSNALIGSATTTLVGVTLAAPTTVQGLTAVVSGRAPAGATVTVYDAFGLPVASAIASDGGLWQSTATLADRGEMHDYALHAETTVGGVTERSPTQYVVHDSHYVVAQSISVSQSDGRVVNFDPAQGVARFPYVFIPGHGLDVSACFGSGATVTSVSARVGPATNAILAPAVLVGSSSAARNAAAVPIGGSGGCYTSHLSPSVNQLGPIYLDYTYQPAPYTAAEMTPPADPTQARQWLDPQFAGYTNATVTSNGDGSNQIGLDLPDYGAHMNARASAGAPMSYVPTASDLSDAASSGVPLYAMHTDASLDGDDIDFTITALVPTSLISGNSLRANAIHPDGATITVQPVKLGGQIVGGALALYSALHSGEPYQKLSQMLAALDQCNDPSLTQPVVGDLTHIANVIAGLQAAKAVAFAVGFLGGLAFLGVGGPILGGALSWALSHKISQELDLAQMEVNDALELCHNEDDMPVADPDWVIDPSGFTFEAVPANRLSGVTATLLRGDSADGPFHVWDATAYGQQNPLTTDHDGRYGWNVPFGYWKVAYTKPGYATAYSKVFTIPPPRFDVNVGLVRLAPPTVALTRATSGASSGVTVGFDDYLNVDSVTGRITVTDAGGNAVPGTVTAVDAQQTPGGTTVARTFRFLPVAPFADNAALTLTIDPLVRDYADHVLGTTVTRQLTAVAASTPSKPTDVRAFANDAGSATIEWAAPADDGGTPVTGYHVSITPGGQSVDVAADATSATLTGLVPLTAYTLSVAAVNGVGAGDAADEGVTTPPMEAGAAIAVVAVPPAVDGGATVHGTVTVGTPAGAGGDTMTLSSSNPQLVTVPASVTIPEGATQAGFDIVTTNPARSQTAIVTISRGGVDKQVPVTVDHVAVPLQATVSGTTVKLAWAASTDPLVTGYRVLRAKGDGAMAAVADVGPGATTYSDTGLAAATTYHYQVEALLSDTTATPWSGVTQATIVGRTTVRLSATASPAAPVYGDAVTVTVTMTPVVPGATVTVAEGSTVLGEGTVGGDGIASVVLPGLHAGTHTLTVSFAGDDANLPATTTVSVTVGKAATRLTVDPLQGFAGFAALIDGTWRVTAHLVRASDGASIAGATITIDSWKGDICVGTTDSTGTVTCPLPHRQRVAVLLGVVHASFAGSPDYLPSSYGVAVPPGQARGHQGHGAFGLLWAERGGS